MAEIYFRSFLKLPGAPIRALRGFTRVPIGAGKTEHVRMALDPRDLSHVNEAGARIIAPGSYRLSIGGGQPAAGAPGRSRLLSRSLARLNFPNKGCEKRRACIDES